MNMKHLNNGFSVNIVMLSLMILIPCNVQAERLTEEQKLGKDLYRDSNLSINKNQSCASCHSLKTIELFGG